MDIKLKLKPTCHEVHRLISEGLDRKLTRIERIRLHLHLLVCDICRRFSAQMQLLHQAMQRFEIQGDASPEPEPPPK
jgi:predicted anti-sigma-YlaC factor YlaD